MKTVDDYLNEAKDKVGSDYAVAKTLGVSRQAVSTWRKRGSLDNENAFKLAQLIGVNPLEVIAAGEASKNPEKANFWAKWGAVAAVILSLAVLDFSSENQYVRAETLVEHSIHYTNLKIRPAHYKIKPSADCHLRTACSNSWTFSS